MQATPTSAPTLPAAEGRHIFLVDDDPRTLGVLEAVLSEAGFPVRSFQSGREALDAFGRYRDHPRLLITDYGMEEMNGFELIQRCRALSPQLKVIVLSGTLDDEAAHQFPFRFELFLAKPIRAAELVGAVHQFLSQARPEA